MFSICLPRTYVLLPATEDLADKNTTRHNLVLTPTVAHLISRRQENIQSRHSCPFFHFDSLHPTSGQGHKVISQDSLVKSIFSCWQIFVFTPLRSSISSAITLTSSLQTSVQFCVHFRKSLIVSFVRPPHFPDPIRLSIRVPPLVLMRLLSLSGAYLLPVFVLALNSVMDVLAMPAC
ncbi:hypothetical protein F5878DRAFT_332866 [Lentinula raphanica]|uniref:Uncharacterized protein n=1 Tax=Lentinula raphanica TaxID=153919 RepID=A0AA38P2P8_9AGAR|nr:hypothetical protein F5878DRAFT_332866 [Lentinula raphanica]